MKLNVFGYAAGTLGYNTHTRGFVDGLTENDVDVSFIPMDNRVPAKPSRILIDSVKRGFDFDSPSVCLSAPVDFHRFYGKRRIGYTVWETTRLPPGWNGILNKMDDVWTVSKFCKKTFEDSGVDKDVKVIPEGVDTSIFNPYVQKIPRRSENTFIFFSVFKWERRKGPDVLLKAFSEEFKEDDKVGLVLQTHNPFLERFNPYEQIVRMNLGKMPLAEVLPVAENEYEMAKRYASSDCFVLPTRGESWGLPIIEAMACGVPVITTNWGGHLEFMKKDFGWLIDVESMEMPEDEPFFKPYDKNEWANPSVKHLRELMRYAFEHQDEGKSKGIEAYGHVDENYGWKKSTAIVKELLKE